MCGGDTLQSEGLNCSQDTDGTSCRCWNNRNIFQRNDYLISCTHAGAEKKDSAVSCCFQLDVPAVSRFQSNTQQVLEHGGKLLRDDGLAELGFRLISSN